MVRLSTWHEFWITVKRLPTAVHNNTHEVNVCKDGSLAPETLQVILGGQNEFGSGSNLGLELSGGSAFGAVDVDFFAYKEGVLAPPTPGLTGDYNNDHKVDAADYVIWRNGGPLQNETATLGVVTAEDYSAWRGIFGASSSGGAGSLNNAVPEASPFRVLIWHC
jgi:hypothetical protein